MPTERTIALKEQFLESSYFAHLKEGLSEHGIEITIAGVSSGVIVLGLYGSALVGNAVILAVTTTAGIVLIGSKLPKKVQKTLVKYGLATDLVAAVGTYCILGATVTSLLAAGLVGIFCSIGIWALKPCLLEQRESLGVQIDIELV